MRRSMNIILAVFVTCSLLLTVQHSILAQAKSKQRSQKSGKTQVSGVERYRAITQNNLFMPLGSGGEVKHKGFVLTGILGNSAFIQKEGSGRSFFVVKGQSFSNGAKLVRIGGNSVTIVHEGNKKELELAGGTFASQGRDAKGGKTRQQQQKPGKNSKGMKAASSAGKGREGGPEKQGGGKGGGDKQWARNMSRGELGKVREDIEKYIEGLEKKGVRDPEAYAGAYEKMQTVDDAIAEKGE